jgi:peroxiredoxin
VLVYLCVVICAVLSDAGAKVSEAYGSALEVPFIGRFANRQTYIISPQGKVVKVFTDVESRVTRHSVRIASCKKGCDAGT